MRNFLLLVLVLSLSTVASAALSWTVTGTAAAGNTLTLELVADFDVDAMDIMVATDNGNGGTATPVSVNANFNVFGDAGYNGAAYGYTAGDLVYANGASGPGPPHPTGIIFTYDYTISGTWDGTAFDIDVIPGAYGEGNSRVHDFVRQADITAIPSILIPEPITIMLLGLGGLFLRRRK
jgi:hypothetical protein